MVEKAVSEEEEAQYQIAAPFLGLADPDGSLNNNKNKATHFAQNYKRLLII